MRQTSQLIWIIFVMIFLAACGQNVEEATATPTEAVAEPEEVEPSATAVPSQTPTAEPLPTDTAVPEPTATNTVEVEPTAEPGPTPEAAAKETEVVIEEVPTEFVVGQEITISGQALPVPAENVVVRLEVAGGLEVVREAVPAAADSGAWNATFIIPPEIVGPADLTVHLASAETGPLQRVQIVPDRSSEESYIEITAVKPNETAVTGYTVFFEGVVNQPVSDTVTISILDNDCTTNAASQSFTVPGGSWFGFTIVSAIAEPGPACAIALTGSQAAGNGREYRTPLNLVPADDPEAIFLEVGLIDEIELEAGQSTYLFGLAINAPDNEVMIKLDSDDSSRPSALITSGSAFADQFGFWEIDLDIPEDAAGGAILYVTSGNNEENYREIRVPVVIGE